MAVNTSSFLSQTLHSITNIKKREVDKRMNLYEAHKSEAIEKADSARDERSKVNFLLSAFRDLAASKKGISYVDDDRTNTIQNITRHLEQSTCDPSFSNTLIHKFERNLREKLDQESERLLYAKLYYRLLNEWIASKNDPMMVTEQKEEDLEGSYEHVQKYTLQNLKEKFSSVVFTPLETDEVEIDVYLNSLFDDNHARGVLNNIRSAVNSFARSLDRTSDPFNRHLIKMCIKALLSNDLLNDKAKTTMSGFSTNDVVLDEIADVLNLRFSDIANWSWEADEGMLYEPRRQANGKFRIMMDQYILQAIFLHYVAISWCVELKKLFSTLPADTKFWKRQEKMTKDEELHYTYFSRLCPGDSGVAKDQMNVFNNTFLLSSLPDSLTAGSDPYGDDGNDNDEAKRGLNIRQTLLKQIATDVIIRRRLYGQVAVVQSDLQWYATGMPHSSLFAVLRFFGVPENWINFFEKFAQAPLRMSEIPGENVLVRRRGIPITDAFEKLFGETVLFCMDLAVNRISGATLIRFHDDLWLSGDPSTCADAWETIEGFVKVLGLDINASKTGSVYISDGEKDDLIASKFPSGPVCMGMLRLTENGHWEIDQKQVSAHVRQLKKQLDQATSIIGWIHTWNACMGKFFQNTFGKPANCFGQAHVNAILETHANMQHQIFESHNGSVTQYLREQVYNRFGVQDVPDSFFFAPEEFGGLGLQNPFIHFFVLKDQLTKDPLTHILQYQDTEKKAYEKAKEAYGALSDSEKEIHLTNICAHNQARVSANKFLLTSPFPSFLTFTSHQLHHSHHLLRAYRILMQKPKVQDIKLTHEMKPWFDELRHSHSLSWEEMSSENKWIMQSYAEELKEKFGSLSIMDRNLLPSGVMKMVKSKREVWQLVIWE